MFVAMALHACASPNVPNRCRCVAKGRGGNLRKEKLVVRCGERWTSSILSRPQIAEEPHQRGPKHEKRHQATNRLATKRGLRLHRDRLLGRTIGHGTSPAPL